jgi:hypothetical protein
MGTAVNRDGPGTYRAARYSTWMLLVSDLTNSLSQLLPASSRPDLCAFLSRFLSCSHPRFPFRVDRHKERITKALLCSGYERRRLSDFRPIGIPRAAVARPEMLGLLLTVKSNHEKAGLAGVFGSDAPAV